MYTFNSFQPKDRETDDSVVFAASGGGDGVNFVMQSSISVSTSQNLYRGLHVEELDVSESESVCKACLLSDKSSDDAYGLQTGLVKKPPKHSCAKKFFESEFTGNCSSLQATETFDRGQAWDVVDSNRRFWNRQLKVKRSISYDHMPFLEEKDEKSQKFEVCTCKVN
jgi:hypothetical protein